MPSILKISEAVTLALHAMSFLKDVPMNCVSAQTIAETLHVSHAHLSKVLQRLEHAGLIRGKRGPQGGFVLAYPPDQISLLQIYEVIEGPHLPLVCLLNQPACGKPCAFGGIFQTAEAGIKAALAEKTLAEVEVRFNSKALKEEGNHDRSKARNKN